MGDILEILLVEDDPADAELTLRSLQAENGTLKIEVARDGEEALDFLFRRGPHSGRSPACRPYVILLDLKLPKVNGLEVLKAIKSDPETQAIPVVIFSSSDQDTDLVECYRLGVNSYVQKPTDFEGFRKVIRAMRLYWLEVNQLPPGYGRK